MNNKTMYIKHCGCRYWLFGHEHCEKHKHPEGNMVWIEEGEGVK